MTMLLQWGQPEPTIALRWRGQDKALSAIAAAASPYAIPTLIGPPGVPGEPGPAGPVPDIIDGGTFN